MKLKDTLTGLFVLMLLGGIGYLWLAPSGLARAPDITLSTLHGEKIPLSTLRGQPVLVNFWATSCPGCIKEMPHLVELYEELAPKGFEIIGIAMSYDPPDHVIALTNARKLPYPIALDIKGDAARAFGDVRLTPSSFLIAPDGRIVHQKIGEMDMPKVRALIIDMLAQTDSPPLVNTN
ncbi:Putative thioredoxin [hydrothermal vent metagenome]|uniref:Thioredoxin n=1 Tax=hydrothermal vent metagenome TaxID=652676 RepID=A0A3B0YJG3_9ZZZZ